MKKLLREWKRFLAEQTEEPVGLSSEPVSSTSPQGKEGQTSTATAPVRDLASLIRVNWKAINYVLRKFLLSKGDSLPFHVRGYIEYLSGRTAPFTEQDLQPVQYDELKKYMYDLVHGNYISKFFEKDNVSIPHGSQIDPLLKYLKALNKFSEDHGSFVYDINLNTMTQLLGATVTGYGNEIGSSISDRLSQPIAGQLSTFLGQYAVTNNGSGATILDHYDFNAANKSVEYLKSTDQQLNILDILEGLFTPVITQLPDLELGTSSGFREILYIFAGILTASGYKGYPVNIKLGFPINKDLIKKNIGAGYAKLPKNYAGYSPKAAPNYAPTKSYARRKKAPVSTAAAINSSSDDTDSLYEQNLRVLNYLAGRRINK